MNDNRYVTLYLMGKEYKDDAGDPIPLYAYEIDILTNHIVIQWFEGDTDREIIPMHRVRSIMGTYVPSKSAE